MRKRLSIVLTALCALFISCGGGLSQEGTGSISMDAGRVARYLGQHANHSAIVHNKKNGNVVEGLDFIPPIKQEMKVGLSTIGSYTTSTEIVYSQKVTDIDSAAEFEEAMEQFYIECFGKTITLEEIPVGSRIRVKAVLTISELIDEEEFRKKLPSGYTEAEIKELLELAAEAMDTMTYSIEGTSDLFTVHSGSNSVTVRIDLPEEEEDAETNPLFIDDYEHPIVLWNNRGSENKLVMTTGGYTNVTHEEDSSTSVTVGVQAFSKLSPNIQITTDELPSTLFCFGDGCIYAVNEKMIEKYILSTSGCQKDTSFEDINVETLFNSSGYNSAGDLDEIQAIAYTKFNNIEYLFVGCSQYNPTEYVYLSSCGAISLASPDTLYELNISQQNGNMKAITAGIIDSNIIIVYEQNGNLFFHRVAGFDSEWMLGTDGTKEGAKITDFSISTKLSGLGISANANLTDLQIIGNNLYLSFDGKQSEQNTITVGYETDDAESEPNGKPIFVCNGGIAKVNLLAAEPTFTAWNNGEYLLGWYKGTYYNSTRTAVTNATMQPPLSQKNNYFYGAKKFIARKPDELVIADDGAYIEGESVSGTDAHMQSISSLNMNRVVAVNLLDESMSVVDVKVTFNASIMSGTGFGISE